MSLRSTALAVLVLLSQPAMAAGQAASAPAEVAARQPLVAETRHAARFNGQAVAYRAIVAETFLKDAAGRPQASVVTTSYVRTGVKDPARRPVMFVFNGGPGASTTPLHFGAFGPMRRVGEGADQVLIDNPASPLDAVDLVFIDPVGTGYSRPFPGVDGKSFWGRTSDAASVGAVIAQWLQVHGRQASPRYILGQSYGTTRAAMIARDAGALKLDGVLLFALVGNVEGREMPYVTSLPTFATVAWWHKRGDHRGRTVEQVYDEAVRFARADYVTALIQGASLPPAEKQAVARRMSALTGLPVEFILAKDLRLSNQDFMFELLKDQGLRTGQLDGRATRRLDAPAQRPPYDDPGLSFSLEKAPAPPRSASRRDVAVPVGKGESRAVELYFRKTLKFDSPETYTSLNLDVNAAWDYEDRSDANRFLGEAMRANPGMRLFWASGLYDISTPAYRGRYALDQAGVPADRLTAAQFQGGHSVFTEEGNRAALAEAVRRFVRPQGED
ncbi:S10 family peptidase [Phenylobacterium sp.]|uniref:S10 family peptidase n=1 Tax=Phenylobacterium sp. TaxID=1871053 RepID=UPI0035AFBC2A